MTGRFCTAINCMDGRVQLPVNLWLRDRYGIDYVDTITEPGPNRILAEGTDPTLVDSIRRRLLVSVRCHGSKVVAVVGHDDCAGSPVASDVQRQLVRQAVAVVRSWELGVDVIGVWVDTNWQVHEEY
ncbi:MAG: carbonic anhydrase [candidate division WOR-3 bacterium]